MANNDVVTGDLNYADRLWKAADTLRGQVDAAEYKHVVLGLLFLKYISDSFECRRDDLRAELTKDGIKGEQLDRLLESRDEYTAERVFWVPPEVALAEPSEPGHPPRHRHADRRRDPRRRARQPEPQGQAPPRLRPPRHRAGKDERVSSTSSPTSASKAIAARPATCSAESTNTSSASSPPPKASWAASSTRRALSSACWSRCSNPTRAASTTPPAARGGMFVQSEKFVEAHGGRRTDVSIFGQESNPTTWRLAHMNLAIHGIEAKLGEQPADTFLRDQHPDLKADFVLANPPFNVSDWSGQLLRGDKRWAYGDPPVGNANYAWIQHFIHHLAYPNGRGGGVAGFVMANGSFRATPAARARSAARSSRPTSSTASSPCPRSSSSPPASPSASGSSPATRPARTSARARRTAPADARAKPSSSTPASSARCRPACCAC